MAEKRLLLLETNFDVAKRYEDLLRKSVWKIDHKDSLNTFLASMKEDEFDVAIVEGGIVPDKIIAMVLTSKPVVICSDKKPDIEKITTIPRHFSGSDLVNALGKVSFMKVTENTEFQEEQGYSIEETISGEKPILLEPVFDEEEEAELLTPEEDKEPVRSSWEIPDKKEDVDVEAETLVDDGLGKREDGEEKDDLFEKIDEIDSIIMSINKDVGDKNKNDIESFEENHSESSDPFGKDDESADFLFDDNYKYEEKSEDVEIGKISDEEDINSSRVSDFESILSDGDSVKKDKPIEQQKAHEVEGQTARKFEEHKKVPEEFAVPAETEIIADTESEKVEEKPVEGLGKKAEKDSAVEKDVLKTEFRKWLNENARQIIKEVVEEQLKELYGKK